MFRHQGKRRTLRHNLKIASLLSFVAGIVNVAGFLAVQKLTTNVTGHFAFFVDEIFKQNFLQGLSYFLYILFFLLGSFFSNFTVEITSKINDRFIYRIHTIEFVNFSFSGINITTDQLNFFQIINFKTKFKTS